MLTGAVPLDTIAALLAIVALGAVGAARWRILPGRDPRSAGNHQQPTPRRSSPSPTATGWAALLDTISAELRTGSSLSRAWETAVRHHDAHGSAVRPGRSLAESIAREVRDPDEAVVLHVAAAAHSLGGPMAATVDAGASLLRERAATRAEALAHSAQARLSAKVLTAVPVGFAAWSAATSERFRHAANSGVGRACIVVGAIVNVVGWWWMRRIIDRATR